ncbi:DUF6207 family protein [Streptomyces shenzhenensis]|uniref:DUF6207 family protein n=1 Tax=Streptomyces shenzhenensis TaxID=943815 RepID=UPI001F2A941C|nr:DUF6207 family protein [Streptomyces shenzhenensis]
MPYSESGLNVGDVAVADDATALAFQQLLADRWTTSPAQRTQPATRASPAHGCRCYPAQPDDQPGLAGRVGQRSRTTVTAACRVVPATTSTTTSPTASE